MSKKTGTTVLVILVILAIAMGGYFLLKDRQNVADQEMDNYPILDDQTNLDDQTGAVVDEVIRGEIVGAGDNVGAEVSLQDDAWYYDFGVGSVSSETAGYPAAFTVVVPGKELATKNAVVVSNDGLVVDVEGPYQMGELFTVAMQTGLPVGSYSAVIEVTGETTEGEAYSAIFVAVYEVE